MVDVWRNWYARLEHVKSFVSVIKNRSNTQVFSSHSTADLNIIWQSKTTSRCPFLYTEHFESFFFLRTPLINSSSLSLEIRSSCKNNKSKAKNKRKLLLSSSTVCWSTPAEVLVEANYTGGHLLLLLWNQGHFKDRERITV